MICVGIPTASMIQRVGHSRLIEYLFLLDSCEDILSEGIVIDLATKRLWSHRLAIGIACSRDEYIGRGVDHGDTISR